MTLGGITLVAKKHPGFAADRQLKLQLLDRDGPAPLRREAHRKDGKCTYLLRYPMGTCPWCEAQEVRQETLRLVASL